MKVGITAGVTELDKIRIYKEAGFDYIETNFGAYSKATKEQREAFLATLKECGLKCEAMNCFISEKVVGDEFDEKKVKEYLENAFEICSETGLEVVVFGSGGARKIPEGFPYDKAKEQFEYVCRELVYPLCVKYGITVAIENLNKGETNIFNTDEEINETVNRLSLDRIKLLCDNYHMALENEPYTVIPAFGENLVHSHIANPDGRIFPMPEDDHNYAEFFRNMKKAGFEKRVSVEASCPKDMELACAAKKCVEFLKKTIEQA